MDAILGEITLTRRRNKLDEMTNGDGLGGAYTETLSRIQAQPRSRSKLGMDVLMWVSHAKRPLHVDELSHALGVEGSTDLDIRNIPKIETLLECSLGLIVVEEPSSTVRLVHYTLQEHLSNNTNLFPNPHSMIAEICLTYLNFPHVREFSPTLRTVPQTVPFVEYASCHWGTHARSETTESVKTLALRLLDGYDKHISSKVLLLHTMGAEERPLDRDDTPRGFTGLHGAAYFGCVEITVALLETNKVDVRATDFRGNVAIAWASRRGHEGVVRVLLERSYVNSNTPGFDYGSAPLLWAAENGHEGVVRILLERSDVNPDKPDRRRRTPLSWASRNGHEGVVKILLERSDVNPNKLDRRRRTPLSWASRKGHEGVVRMLLGRDNVNPDKPDLFCLTPLSLASESGHEGVVRMLLERNGVNPNKRGLFGVTPLLLASGNKHEGVIRMLLEWNGVDPNQRGVFSPTPLSWASENGHEGVVRILLERNNVNPNQRDLFGLTPLALASGWGHEGVVRMLLQRNDINPDNPDKLRRTPLLWASGYGHEGVVRMLLERSDVNPNKPSLFRLTPLLWASRNGHERIVRMLLEQNDVDPNQRDLFGLTPLSWACENGHEGVVRMLLERNDTNPQISVPRWCLSILAFASLHTLLICVLFLIAIALSYLRAVYD